MQAGFLLAWLDPFMIRMHTVCGPVFHCYSCPFATFACPIGVLANFSASGSRPSRPSERWLVAGAVFGSFICGWACPFGFLQDIVGWIPTPQVRLPRLVERFSLRRAGRVRASHSHPGGAKGIRCFSAACVPPALEGAVPNVARLAMMGEAIVWPTATKWTILACSPFHAFHLAAVVHAVLPAGGDLRTDEPRFVLFLRFRRASCRDCEVCRNLCLDRGRPERRGRQHGAAFGA